VEKTYELHFSVAEQRAQRGGVEMPSFRVHLPFANLKPLIFQSTPRTRIGLVILICNDNRVARREVLPERLRQNIGVLRGRRPKAQLVHLDTQHGGQTGARLVHFRACKGGGLIRRIGLHLALRIISREPTDHRGAGIRPTGVFKKRLALQGRFGKGGKLRAHPVDIKLCHHEFPL